jgi:hypothetical protein
MIAEMRSALGDGHPDTGALFAAGRSGFDKACETLRGAGPNEAWDGRGSRAYADQNARQQLRTETMAAADREVHRVLDREAAQITACRGHLDDRANFLATAGCAALPLQFMPQYGEAAKLTIVLAALHNALSESADRMHQLHSEVTSNAAQLQQAIGRYSCVADGAGLPAAEFDEHSLRPSPAVRLGADISPEAGVSAQDKK